MITDNPIYKKDDSLIEWERRQLANTTEAEFSDREKYQAWLKAQGDQAVYCTECQTQLSKSHKGYVKADNRAVCGTCASRMRAEYALPPRIPKTK